MDDDVTRSSESLPTSEEFELIGSVVVEPQLQIVGGDASEEQLKESLQEVLKDIEGNMLDVLPAERETPNMSVRTDFSGKACLAIPTN